MAKSIRILLAIAAWYDYEIWQMDVKTAFLNSYVEEEIFIDQPEGFTTVGEKQKVCRLQRSIYGLKQASRSWNTRFDEVIRVSMKDMGEASYILGIKIYRDRSRRMLRLTQSSYIESLQTDEELKRMSNIPYASAVESIQYVVQCTRLDVAYALSVTSRYQARAREAH
ncbi:UNVERIFIED_CONTAM: putative transposon Ty5-1 protein [Sesamum latifolium]|uniref:Transposon Ty5-1 protein n=1 Tax=Sesamum latifolium TaxID=2727402 RepID=A0AAW2SQV1_9LAMI